MPIISLACAACCVVSLDQCQLVSCDSPDVLVVSLWCPAVFRRTVVDRLFTQQSKQNVDGVQRQNWMDIEY